MRMLFTHRYFWPDTPPYAMMLRALAEHFAEAGNDVSVFAGMPSYRPGHIASVPQRQTMKDIKIKRCRVLANEKRHVLLRLLNAAIYSTFLFAHILRKRPQIVIAATFPPVIAGFMASLASRLAGARFVYHVQDVHPEISRYSGHRIGSSPAFRLLRALDNATLARAAAIVVLSDDMAATLRSRADRQLPVSVINNFSLTADEDQETETPYGLEKPVGTRRIIFAGNLGRFQNLHSLLDGIVLSLARHPDLELLLLGDGEALPDLKRCWGSHRQVRFAPFLPFSEAKPIIAGSDVGLVSLAPDIFRVSYPSKVATYAMLGVPLLALVEPESALARDIVGRGMGAVPASSSPDDISAALERLLAGSSCETALQAFVDDVAAPKAAFSRWRNLLADLAPT